MAGGKRRPGPGGDFPLDNNLDALAKVVDDARVEIGKLVEGVKDAVKAIKDAAKGATKGSSSGGSSGSSSGGSSSGAAAVTQAKQVTEEQKKQRDLARQTREEKKRIAEEQKRAAFSALMWRNEVEKARNAVEAVKAVGDLAKQLGFKSAAADIEAVAKGLDNVQKLLVGIKDGGVALAAMAGFGAAALVAVGGIQAAVKGATGETLSLKDTIAGAALTLYDVLNQSVAGWKLLFNDLSLFVRTAFDRIGEAILRPVSDALWEFAFAARDLGATLQQSSNPAVAAMGDLLRSVGGSAGSAAGDMELAADRMGRATEQARAKTEAENRAILDSVRAMSEGVNQQVNKLFDAPDGTSLFEDPLKALGEFRTDVRKAFEELPRAFGIQPEVKEKKKEERTPFQNFQNDLQQMANLTQGTFDFISTGVQALSATIASTLVDAFLNPQQDIRETFGQLFRFLAQQILQILIQAAIARAILGGVGAVGAGGAVPVAAADGGEIKAGNHLASLAHFGRGVRGYAIGGVALGRPAGIPASDTVPAWLTPGEFVQPVAALQFYGRQVMEGLRSLSIPREPLRALASGVQVPQRVATPMPRGYATGGPVAMAGGASSAPAGPVPAVVVANEATFDRLLAGGQGSMMRFMRENRSAIKSVLG